MTSVDFEAEHQVIAREAAVAEDVNPNRYRLINGRIDEVLERLTEGGYDIALVSSKVTDIDKHLTAARNLLRPGGLLIIEGYGPRQMVYKTGGPGVEENLYTLPLLGEAFAGWSLVHSRDCDAELAEGSAHVGASHLVSAVFRKPG